MKKFYNLKYGDCILIDESDNLYLVYSEYTKAIGSFIVCTYIDDMGNMLNQKFFKTFPEALDEYNYKMNQKDKNKKI